MAVSVLAGVGLAALGGSKIDDLERRRAELLIPSVDVAVQREGAALSGTWRF